METQRKDERKVCLIWSPHLAALCGNYEKEKLRIPLTYGLLYAYGLFRKLKLVPPKPAKDSDLLEFHTKEYVNTLRKTDDKNFDQERLEMESTELGLGGDCPALPGLFTYVCHLTGASLAAVDQLISANCSVAINWAGGWHHAKRDEAFGFCYVNDCVLAIQRLRKLGRVLYLDLDAHHGDGVQDAFFFSPNVMCVSFHAREPGFFPGTGSVKEVGAGKGKYFTVNCPFNRGLTDQQFIATFDRLVPEILLRFRPSSIVVQCGVDGLSYDPVQAFNLTSASYVHCISSILSAELPTLILGGGGYERANAARCWTAVTAECVGTELAEDIPDHSPYWPLFAPQHTISVSAGHLGNQNTQQTLDKLTADILDNINKIPV